MPLENVAVFLNKADEVTDAETRELVEMEIRELLSEFGYPGDSAPVIVGSALEALGGKNSELGVNAITQLLDALDGFSLPPRELEGTVMFPAEHVYNIQGARRRRAAATAIYARRHCRPRHRLDRQTRARNYQTRRQSRHLRLRTAFACNRHFHGNFPQNG